MSTVEKASLSCCAYHVRMYACTCVYICMYACTCTYVRMCVLKYYVCMHMYVCTCVRIYICAYTCICMYMYLGTYVRRCVGMYARLCVCMRGCVRACTICEWRWSGDGMHLVHTCMYTRTWVHVSPLHFHSQIVHALTHPRKT